MEEYKLQSQILRMLSFLANPKVRAAITCACKAALGQEEGTYPIPRKYSSRSRKVFVTIIAAEVNPPGINLTCACP